MNLDLNQLRAFLSIVANGSFESAAHELGVTQSAISQRMKALETAVGRILLTRSKPPQVTEHGQIVMRFAQQMKALNNQASNELFDEFETRPTVIPVAVNNDSLATWVMSAFLSLQDEFCFDIRLEDQSHSEQLLRDGSVMASITTQKDPVAGCMVIKLGVMRYRPMASPEFVSKWFRLGTTVTELLVAPMLQFNRKDDLQHRYLKRRSRKSCSPPTSYVPSTEGYTQALLGGLGWGMMPDQLSNELESDGRLESFDEPEHVDVTLYLQRWSMNLSNLDLLSETILKHAKRALQ